MLREGQIDDKEIEIDVAPSASSMQIFTPPGMEDLSQQLQGMFQDLGRKDPETRKLNKSEALRLVTEEEAQR